MMKKSILFLQGPHGPFFRNLALAFAQQGHAVHRINFNGGDFIDWHSSLSQQNFSQHMSSWPNYLKNFLSEQLITDVVLYGDCRPFHKTAISVAKEHTIKIHVFEEGYLRPHWVTYERDGVNANSTLFSCLSEKLACITSCHAIVQPKKSLNERLQHLLKPQFIFLLMFCMRYYLCMALFELEISTS